MIVGGAIVLVSILRAFGFDEMLVSEADILDGLVRSADALARWPDAIALSRRDARGSRKSLISGVRSAENEAWSSTSSSTQWRRMSASDLRAVARLGRATTRVTDEVDWWRATIAIDRAIRARPVLTGGGPRRHPRRAPRAARRRPGGLRAPRRRRDPVARAAAEVARGTRRRPAAQPIAHLLARALGAGRRRSSDASPVAGPGSVRAAMPTTDRLLLGPGPSNPYPEVMAGLARPLLGHLDPEFLACIDETCAPAHRVPHRRTR